MDYIALIQQYINMKAVLFAIAGTSIFRFLWPSPPKEIVTWFDRFTVREGPVINRLLPVLPVVIAFVCTYYFEQDSRYTMDDAFRGIMSGTFAAYTYKTVKTLIFGE